jgi:hypothetical protein
VVKTAKTYSILLMRCGITWLFLLASQAAQRTREAFVAYIFPIGLSGAELAPCQDRSGEHWHLRSCAPLIDPPFKGIGRDIWPMDVSARWYVVLPQRNIKNSPAKSHVGVLTFP